MRRIIFTTTLFLFSSIVIEAFPQEKTKKERSPESGQLWLAMRTTASVFGSNYPGFGYGGHFRLRLAKKLNTEWFADYITSDIGGKGNRQDGHIGWSVMFYPFNPNFEKGKFVPYAMAGHCFDYTKVESLRYYDYSQTAYKRNWEERWSTAVQMGIGTHYFISDNFDVTLAAQYMTHLGNEIESELKSLPLGKPDETYLVVTPKKGQLSLEGHVLISFSMNVRVGDLWK